MGVFANVHSVVIVVGLTRKARDLPGGTVGGTDHAGGCESGGSDTWLGADWNLTWHVVHTRDLSRWNVCISALVSSIDHGLVLEHNISVDQ